MQKHPNGITVAQLSAELQKLIDAGKSDIPVYAGDFDVKGLLWIADNSTQVFTPAEANALLLEYS